MNQKRRQVVVLDEERDVENPQIEFGNPEDLLIDCEEKEQQRKIDLNIAQLVNAGLFDELTELELMVIVIRYLLEGEDSFTAQQIADALGVSRKTYYNRLNKAVGKLRSNLKDNPFIDQRLKI